MKEIMNRPGDFMPADRGEDLVEMGSPVTWRAVKRQETEGRHQARRPCRGDQKRWRHDNHDLGDTANS